MMNFTIKFYNFFINFNLFIALCSLFMYALMAMKADQNIYLTNGLLVFLMTFLGYHFLRYISYLRGSISRESYHYQLIKNHYKKMMTLYSLVGLWILYLLTLVRSFNFSYFVIAIILFMLYEQVFTTRFSLRRIPFLKNFIIASTWSLIITGMQESPLLITFLDTFLFIFILCLPFDFKDLTQDKSHHLITFANKLHHFEYIIIGLFWIYSLIFTLQKELVFFMVSTILFTIAAFKLKKISHQAFYLIFDGLILMRFLLYLL